jgi:hypothetical protein
MPNRSMSDRAPLYAVVILAVSLGLPRARYRAKDCDQANASAPVETLRRKRTATSATQ